MFDKDIQHYIEEDGELTEEASEILYGDLPPILWESEPDSLWEPQPRWRSPHIIAALIAIIVVGGLSVAIIVSATSSSPDISDTAEVTAIEDPLETLNHLSLCSIPSTHHDWIVFSAGTIDHSNLFLVNPDRTDSICRITGNTDNNHDPAWSPDGTLLAYESRMEDGSVGVSVMDIKSQNIETVIQPVNQPYITAITWGPESDRLILEANTGQGCSDLFITKINGTPQQLTSEETCDITPDWSPDGSMIVFARSKTPYEDLDIYTLNLINGELRQITDNYYTDYSPVWSPDGIHIAFTSDDGIYLTDINGAYPQRIIESGRWPSWSSDGTRITFVSSDGNDKRTESALFVANADGSGIRRVTEYINANQPDWGP